MNRSMRAVVAVLASLLFACQSTGPPLEAVSEVDLERYAGTWYEIASYPQRFQRGCVATQARYTLRTDGRVRVVNECRDGSFGGELRSVEGVAWVEDPTHSTAKLRVRFFWPFSGAYWVIELDDDYRYAVVGHPSRDYLWILSRTRSMDPTLYRTLLERVEAKGFDLDRLQPTPQPDA